MSDLVIAQKVSPPEIPENWDYQESVEKVQGQIYKIRFMTGETVGEIWIANQILDGRGGDRKSSNWKSKVENSTFDNYCEDIGITKWTAYNWFELFGWRSPKRLVGKHTGDQENYTPKAIINAVREVMGSIDLDPASCEKAQEIVQAEEYFTEDDDGLSQSWHGNLFLNPPYQMPQIRQFTDKLIEELPHLNAAILLTNNNTDTLWFHNCSRSASVICFTKGRINFYTAEIEETQPTNGQSFFYFGKEEKRFIEVFEKYGMMMKVINHG